MTTNNDIPKRGRGRPPKPRPPNPPPKRPVGRPRKPIDPNAPPPRPRGRPVMAEEDRKSVHVPTRLTASEHELWSRLAKEDGMTLNKFINRAVTDWIKRKGKA